jgi:hypothetical protein
MDVDVLLCPTTFTTASPPDDRPIEERTIPTAAGPRKYNDLAAWISQASVAGLPALTVPAGLASDGLPVGLQVVAAHTATTPRSPSPNFSPRRSADIDNPLSSHHQRPDATSSTASAA